MKKLAQAGGGWTMVMLFAWILLGRMLGVCEEGTNSPAASAKFAYEAAKTRYEKDLGNAEAAWKLGQASYDWAEYAKDDASREKIALYGIRVCEALTKRQPKNVAGHYYLAMNRGQLARTKLLGALKLVGDMEKGFKTALGLDPSFDHGGPERNLGLLYLEAPSWPASIGSRPKARQFLEKAVKRDPGYPENRLNLGEAYQRWGDREEAKRELKALDEMWSEAEKKFAGEDWEVEWADWKARREKLRNRIELMPGGRRAEL